MQNAAKHWPHRVADAAWTILLCAVLASSSSLTVANADSPVYVHMNGANFFLEPVVAVEPGQPVIFVSQDSGGVHTIVGYNAQTGAPLSSINGTVAGSARPGRAVSTYTVRLATVGVYAYYCPVHAVLAKTFGGAVQSSHRPGVDGFKGAMAGIIVVTRDRALVGSNPASSKKEIVPGFFGG